MLGAHDVCHSYVTPMAAHATAGWTARDVKLLPNVRQNTSSNADANTASCSVPDVHFLMCVMRMQSLEPCPKQRRTA